MNDARRTLLVVLLATIVAVACPVRGGQQPGSEPSTTPSPITGTPTVTPAPADTPAPEVNPLPTPTISPVALPPGCSLDDIASLIEDVLAAFNAGDTERLAQHIPSHHQPASVTWFGVAARDSEGIPTGTFATTPDEFLRYAAERHQHGERLEPLELVAIESEPSRRDAGSQVVVTVALLRQADDLIARPVLAQLTVTCPERAVTALSMGDSSSGELPADPLAVLVSALRERPLDLPELTAEGECPRSEWAFDLAIGDGPVYLAIGPDGVVNLGGPLAIDREDGEYLVRTSWFVGPAYAGPLVVRGRQLDGDGIVRFARDGSSADTLAEELVLPPALSSEAMRDPAGWTSWPTTLAFPGAGCYAIQVDGADFQQVLVVQAVDGLPGDILPLPPDIALPRDLVVLSAVRTADHVRLALWNESLVIRLSTGLSGPGTVELADATACLDDIEGIGQLCWQAAPEAEWPQAAVWDDGRRRYRLVVLEAEPGAWSLDDLVALAQAFRGTSQPSENE